MGKILHAIIEWLKGPEDDEEVIEAAARKAAAKAAAQLAAQMSRPNNVDVPPKRKVKKGTKRFPAVTSLKTLTVLAKNTAKGADQAYESVAGLEVELQKTVAEIARLRNPANADDDTRQALSVQRAQLRDNRDTISRKLALARDSGASLEVAADEYAFLIKALTGEAVDYRKKPRFNETACVKITDSELDELCRVIMD